MRQSEQVQTLQSDQKSSKTPHMEAISNPPAHAGGDGVPVVGRAALEALVVAAEASLQGGNTNDLASARASLRRYFADVSR